MELPVLSTRSKASKVLKLIPKELWGCSTVTTLSPNIISGTAMPKASVIFSIGSALSMGNLRVVTLKPFRVIEWPASPGEGHFPVVNCAPFSAIFALIGYIKKCMCSECLTCPLLRSVDADDVERLNAASLKYNSAHSTATSSLKLGAEPAQPTSKLPVLDLKDWT